MDKAQFVRMAPAYYALAIVQYLLLKDLKDAPETHILDHYNDLQDADDEALLPFEPLFERAIDWLAAERLITVLVDPFAPRMILRTDFFDEEYVRICQDKNLPFYTYSKLTNAVGWLYGGLVQIEQTRQRLGVVDADLTIDEWAPLPLDRSEPEVSKIIETIEQAIEEVRANNGYAQSQPEERSFVLAGLLAFSSTLKEATAISIPFIRRYGMEPLAVLTKRFSKTALEVVIGAAKEAIKAWLSKHGVGWLDTWLK